MDPDKLEDLPGAPLAALITLVRAQPDQLSPGADARGALVAEGAVEKLRGRRRIRPRASAFAVAAAALVVAFVVVSRPWVRRTPLPLSASAVPAPLATASATSAPALSFSVDGGRIGVGGTIEAEGDAEARLAFSDGTEVRLARGTRASIRALDAFGARLSLAEGSAHVDVVHLPGARWSIDAGPFRIAVTGTAFTVGWAQADERLDVRMERGNVEIAGPLSDNPIALRSGQHLVVRARERETLIRDADDPVASPPALSPAARAGNGLLDAPRPAASPARRGSATTGRARMTAVPSPHPSAPSAPSADRPDWSAELAAGDFEAILGEAERRGVDACLADASSADLADLADAARFEQRDGLARRALLAQRRRFPLSGPARDAAFLLGRVEEAERSLPAALTWYDTYLAESPGGAYASEALGRKMVASAEVSGEDRARQLALEYLGRFPQGAYAARARAFTRRP
jgi:hypothetical protein